MTHVSCSTIVPLCPWLKEGRPHGDASSGLAVRASHAGEVTGIHGDCDLDAGAGHWSEYGAILGRQWRPAQSAGVPTPRPARRGIWKESRIRSSPDHLSEFPGLP